MKIPDIFGNYGRFGDSLQVATWKHSLEQVDSLEGRSSRPFI
ncbi:MAG: hypothetical protein JWO45_1724 [Spartobacteria bacterium]|nr:hypothetical protein [Spartobacteria bacterium]